MRNTLIFNVNGRDRKLENPNPLSSLAEYLREIGLTGCKIACGEGACGSCTVVIGRKEGDDLKYRAVNACVTPLFHIDGAFVLTVEAVGNSQGLHAIQKRLAVGHASQCGFCTPGFVMSAYAAARSTKGNPTRQDIDQAIKGNRCRCTGYRPIVESLYSLEGCCQGSSSGGCPCKEQKLITFDGLPGLDEGKEIIFPPSLQVNPPKGSLQLQNENITLYIPETLEELKSIIKQNPSAKLISSGMISRMKGPNKNETWISVSQCFRQINVEGQNLLLGSSLSITDMLDAVEKHCNKTVSNAFQELFYNFSSSQIANLATWAGSIATSPAGDVVTLTRALNAQVHVLKPNGESQSFSIKEILTGIDGVITEIQLPRNLDGQLFVYKAGKRHGPDSGVVNFAAYISGSRSTAVVGALNRSLEASSFGFCFNNGDHSEKRLLSVVEKDLGNILTQFELDLVKAAVITVSDSLSGKSERMDESKFTSEQIYEKEKTGPVGEPVSHVFAERNVTGEAVFVEDMAFKDGLYLGFVLSTEAHAKFEVDPSEALKMSGVLGYYDAKSVPGTNYPGKISTMLIFDDAPLFAEGKVMAEGQPIAVVAAEDAKTAQLAAQAVRVKYEKLPAILTIEQAIEAKSELANVYTLGAEEDEVTKELSASTRIIEGELFIGGQEHYYMEPQCAAAVPGEAGEITLYSSTQSCSIVQLQTAAFLGLEASQITVRTKRLGGGFGGKSFQSVFVAATASLVARDLKRPVTAVYTRREDCLITGKRHPMLGRYRVGFDNDGRLQAAYLKLYFDGGYVIDHSQSVTMVGTMMSDSCYRIPVIRSEGYTMKTNKSSNTAMRGYGHPQAFTLWEVIMNKIADNVQKPLEQVKEMNFNPAGGVTINGSTLQNDAMERCWTEALKYSEFNKLRTEVNEFNANHRRVKRGLAVATTRFGLTHANAYEQASALVQVFLDGSVTVSIGGVEMGQGLSIKCLQVAATALGRPLSKVRLGDASTDKTANVPETGGSQGADIHGKAIQLCCARILENLNPLIKEKGTWEAAVWEANNRRLPLQASEHMRIERTSFGLKENQSTYFTTGAAVVVVEIDVTSGDHKLLKTDIVMDVGKSLNPAIDVGQIEGGFMQGYGMLTCEELLWDKEGHLITNSIGNYSMPTAAMVPSSFRIKFLTDSPTYEFQVHSSKGIGEPPLLLGTAALSAITDAIGSYRKEKGIKEKFSLDETPLTREKILQMCRV